MVRKHLGETPPVTGRQPGLGAHWRCPAKGPAAVQAPGKAKGLSGGKTGVADGGLRQEGLELGLGSPVTWETPDNHTQTESQQKRPHSRHRAGSEKQS